MATVEIELRSYEKANGTRPLVMRVTSGSKVSRKNTGLYVRAEEWDAKKRKVNRKHPAFATINDALTAMCKEAEGLKAEALAAREAINPDEVLRGVFSTHDFYSLLQQRIDALGRQQDYNNQKNYASLLAVLRRYRTELLVEEVTPRFIEGFRTHLLELGRKHNTVVAHLSKMRAVLNAADLRTPNPFDRVKVGSYQAAAEQVPSMADIQKIRRYVARDHWDAVAKDTFLFSFYAAGMSSKDVLQLTWGQIVDGRLVFGRAKVKKSSGVQLSLPINSVLQEILDRRPTDRPTVFDLLKLSGEGKAASKEREAVQTLINRALKAIALRCGLSVELKYKMARTAFARIANELSGRDVYGIQQAMGHSKISTTEIYLGSDGRAIDGLLAKVYG